jgi:TatD DNase family protein
MPAYYDIHTHSSNLPENVVQIRSLFPHQLPLIEQHSGVWYSVGWHPWHFDENNPDAVFPILEQALQNEQVIALGETGLDRNIATPMDHQQNILIRHLDLANTSGKPVIIHAVRSYPDIIQVYKNAKVAIPLIIHGFRGNQQSAEQLLDHGFYLSFGAALLENNDVLEQVFRNIPSEKLFLETDDSKIDISQIYEKAASLRNLKLEQMMEIIESNFKTCFAK